MKKLVEIRLKTGNVTYKRLKEVRSCNHYCSGKTVLHTVRVCICVALVIQNAKRMCHIVTCALPGSTILLYVIL